MDLFNRYLPAIEEEMRKVLTAETDAPQLLHGMLHYHMGWVNAEFIPAEVSKGKRLRPIFLLLANEAQAGEWQQALPAAAAVELLHNFTLIHDDIEDRDTTRRGRPTLWTIWGEAQSINAGDALFTLAYRALLNLNKNSVSAARTLQATEHFTQCVLQLTQGQCLDIQFETQNDVSEATYLQMIKGKTAALLGLACELGGIIAGATKPRIAALYEFGESVGMAFQMEDDLLGLWGDPERTGKAVAADLRRGKKTLPILHGLEHSPELRALLRAELELNDTTVNKALTLLEASNSRDYTQSKANFYNKKALAALKRTHGSGEAQAALLKLSEKLLTRDK